MVALGDNAQPTRREVVKTPVTYQVGACNLPAELRPRNCLGRDAEVAGIAERESF